MTTTVRKRHLQLQAQLDAAEMDDDTLWTLLNEATRNLYRVNHERAALTVYRQALRREADDRKLNPSVVRVTDHAIVRYLERIEHVDVEAIKARIIEMVAGAEDDGRGNRLTADGILIAFDEPHGVVTTVYKPGEEGYVDRMISG